MKVLKNQQGLTLIELFVVIVIFGIIEAIVIPMVVNNSTKAQLNANQQNR
jgi:prepilin-type N-terminal cleavage/methylation domain-containing protein